MQVNNKQYREVLVMLSQTYGEPNLTTAERDKLLDWLDPLAAKVIYSTEHLGGVVPMACKQADARCSRSPTNTPCRSNCCKTLTA